MPQTRDICSLARHQGPYGKSSRPFCNMTKPFQSVPTLAKSTLAGGVIRFPQSFPEVSGQVGLQKHASRGSVLGLFRHASPLIFFTDSFLQRKSLLNDKNASRLHSAKAVCIVSSQDFDEVTKICSFPKYWDRRVRQTFPPVRPGYCGDVDTCLSQ